MLLIQLLASQGGGHPRRGSTKVAILATFILVVILLNLFSSILLNIILKPPEDRFSNLEQLITSTGIHLSRISTFYVGTFLDIELKQFNRSVQEVNFNGVPPQSLDEKYLTVFTNGLTALSFMNKGRLAFAADSSTAEGVMAKHLSPAEICELRSKVFLHQPYSLVVPKRSPFFEMIQIAAIKMRENGLLNRQFKHFIPSQPYCQAGISLYSVPLAKVASAFYILVGKFYRTVNRLAW